MNAYLMIIKTKKTAEELNILFKEIGIEIDAINKITVGFDSQYNVVVASEDN